LIEIAAAARRPDMPAVLAQQVRIVAIGAAIEFAPDCAEELGIPIATRVDQLG
jgi:hypothetical protein